MVITGQGTTTEHELSAGDLSGHIQVVGIEMTPQRDVPGQPRQERQAGDRLKGPRQILEHVVVGVNETRQCYPSAGIHYRGLRHPRRWAGPHGANHTILSQQPRVPEDPAIQIHGDQIANVLEESPVGRGHGYGFKLRRGGRTTAWTTEWARPSRKGAATWDPNPGPWA